MKNYHNVLDYKRDIQYENIITMMVSNVLYGFVYYISFSLEKTLTDIWSLRLSQFSKPLQVT